MTDHLQDLLVKTSRTFALSIPMLPEPTLTEVRVAYLLFRLADTFEDSTLWSRARRVEALETFCRLLDEDGDQEDAARRLAAEWTAQPPLEHEGYLELLAELPAVLAGFRALSPEARHQVREHTRRTARGMAGFVERTDDGGRLELRDVPDLQAYCYVVAGIVGEMLTELFLLGREDLEPAADYLRRRSAKFGEALQLVNILKDSADDAVEGRRYLPAGADRGEVFRIAREDLHTASDYTERLREAGAPRGIVAFCALPVLLAWATLQRVEEAGAGAKLTRPEVFAITLAMDRALDGDQPVIPASVRDNPIPRLTP